MSFGTVEKGDGIHSEDNSSNELPIAQLQDKHKYVLSLVLLEQT